jgi:two-component system, response regulator
MDVKREFGIIVKDRRTRLGLSQEALAERADLHRTYVTDIERGTRNLTLANISKLAGAFGLSISQMFPAGATFPGEPTQTAAQNDLVDILMVEDSLRDIELTLGAFKQARMTNRVHVVCDGEEALDFLLCRGQHRRRLMENPLGAVLLDLDLPKVHGIEVLRRIKAEARLSHIKVIVLSMSRRDAGVVEAMNLGAVGCIVKPVDFQNFSQMTSKLDFTWTLLKPEATPTR